LPAEYNNKKEYMYIIVHDGNSFLKYMDMKLMLDSLIENKFIPPIIVLFVDPGMVENQTKRYEEYPCNPEFATYIAKELIPWVRKQYNISKNPKNAIVIGSSYGGLTSG
jgi:enterochelin esterase family protein